MGPLKHPLQTEADQARMGVDTRVRFCACGTAIGPRAKRCRRCTHRLAQARYRHTAKGKATETRYWRSEKGQAKNARRIWVGRTCRGRARTIEQATAIRSHIRERIRELKQKQKAACA